MLTSGGSGVSLRGQRKPGLHGKGWGISVKAIPRANSSLVAMPQHGAGSSSVY